MSDCCIGHITSKGRGYCGGTCGPFVDDLTSLTTCRRAYYLLTMLFADAQVNAVTEQDFEDLVIRLHEIEVKPRAAPSLMSLFTCSG